MPNMSRRTLLGTGTATAATLLATGASAPAASAATTSKPGAHSDTTPATQFDNGTKFSGTAIIPNPEENGELDISFTVACPEAQSANAITALDVANALNALAASRGWPHITFYGTPVPAPLN